MAGRLEIIPIIVGLGGLLIGLSIYIVRLIIKINFNRMSNYFSKYAFSLNKNEITLDTLREVDENNILHFVYYKIPQMRIFLWALLVPLNVITTPTIICFLFFKTTGKFINKLDFVIILLSSLLVVFIQTFFIIIIEKGKVEFDELKLTKLKS